MAEVLSFFASVANTLSPKKPDGSVRAAADYCNAKQFRERRVVTDDYRLSREVLGEGCQGAVTVAVEQRSGERFALKTLWRLNADGTPRRRAASEAAILADLDHPHIVRLVDLYESGEELALVMECLGWELFERLSAKGLTEAEAAASARQMLLALSYLHERGVVHRDVKLENFLYDREGCLKLVDFGHAAVLTPGHVIRERLGTPDYVAPEVLEGAHGTQCDMWSLGVCVYALVGGSLPFDGKSLKGKRRIQRGAFEFCGAWDKASPLARDFVQRLLQPKQHRRMTAAEALAHPWLQSRAPRSCVGAGLLPPLRAWLAASPLTRACRSAEALRARGDDKARAMFLELSPSGTGKLSEVSANLGAKLGAEASSVEQLVAALDVAGCGRVSYSDFAAALSSCRCMRPEQVERVFRGFDRASRGSVSSLDLAAATGASSVAAAWMLQEIGPEVQGSMSLDELSRFLVPHGAGAWALCSRRRTSAASTGASGSSWSEWRGLRLWRFPWCAGDA